MKSTSDQLPETDGLGETGDSRGAEDFEIREEDRRSEFSVFFPPNGAKSLIVTEDSPRREDIEIEEEFCGANVQFFSSQRCEKSNRQPSEIQSMLEWNLIDLSGRE